MRLRNAALRFDPDPQLLIRLGVKDTPQSSPMPDPNRRKVWVLRAGKPVPAVVSTGVTDGTWSELVQGDVRPGDLLITDMSLNQRGGLF